MGLLNFLDPALDLLFGWTLRLHPALAIFALSAIVVFLITLITKYTTDQAAIKRLRAEQKKLQEQIKKHKDDPKRMMEIQQRSMESSFALMRKSMRATIFTIVPVLILFAWMNNYLAVSSAAPGEPFAVMAATRATEGAMVLTPPAQVTLLSNASVPLNQSQASWRLEGAAGVHALTVEFQGVAETKEVIIATDLQVPRSKDKLKEPPFPLNVLSLLHSPREGYLHADSPIERISVDYAPIHPLEPFHLFGWHPGFLGAYILFSFGLSFLFRKLLKVA